jgi:hypothetical protein
MIGYVLNNVVCTVTDYEHRALVSNTHYESKSPVSLAKNILEIAITPRRLRPENEEAF